MIQVALADFGVSLADLCARFQEIYQHQTMLCLTVVYGSLWFACVLIMNIRMYICVCVYACAHALTPMCTTMDWYVTMRATNQCSKCGKNVQVLLHVSVSMQHDNIDVDGLGCGFRPLHRERNTLKPNCSRPNRPICCVCSVRCTESTQGRH